MTQLQIRASLLASITAMVLIASSAQAHDPVFGMGPHTLFKGGVELHLGSTLAKAENSRSSELVLQLNYGITADWVAGFAIPYQRHNEAGQSVTGRGASSIASKYRFWRDDLPGAQRSAALLAQIIFDDGDFDGSARDGSDYLLGLSYGYEGRRWYRWASVRHRFNSDGPRNVPRGDMTHVDLVIGIRPIPTEYHQADWVWMLELNGEIGEHISALNSNRQTKLPAGSQRNITPQDSGGQQWFLAPGLMWTKRNFAVKAGIQLPIFENLEGRQQAADYRFKFVLEWHL